MATKVTAKRFQNSKKSKRKPVVIDFIDEQDSSDTDTYRHRKVTPYDSDEFIRALGQQEDFVPGQIYSKGVPSVPLFVPHLKDENQTKNALPLRTPSVHKPIEKSSKKKSYGTTDVKENVNKSVAEILQRARNLSKNPSITIPLGGRKIPSKGPKRSTSSSNVFAKRTSAPSDQDLELADTSVSQHLRSDTINKMNTENSSEEWFEIGSSVKTSNTTQTSLNSFTSKDATNLPTFVPSAFINPVNYTSRWERSFSPHTFGTLLRFDLDESLQNDSSIARALSTIKAGLICKPWQSHCSCKCKKCRISMVLVEEFGKELSGKSISGSSKGKFLHLLELCDVVFTPSCIIPPSKKPFEDVISALLDSERGILRLMDLQKIFRLNKRALDELNHLNKLICGRDIAVGEFKSNKVIVRLSTNDRFGRLLCSSASYQRKVSDFEECKLTLIDYIRYLLCCSSHGTLPYLLLGEKIEVVLKLYLNKLLRDDFDLMKFIENIPDVFIIKNDQDSLESVIIGILDREWTKSSFESVIGRDGSVLRSLDGQNRYPAFQSFKDFTEKDFYKLWMKRTLNLESRYWSLYEQEDEFDKWIRNLKSKPSEASVGKIVADLHLGSVIEENISHCKNKCFWLLAFLISSLRENKAFLSKDHLILEQSLDRVFVDFSCVEMKVQLVQSGLQDVLPYNSVISRPVLLRCCQQFCFVKVVTDEKTKTKTILNDAMLMLLLDIPRSKKHYLSPPCSLKTFLSRYSRLNIQWTVADTTKNKIITVPGLHQRYNNVLYELIYPLQVVRWLEWKASNDTKILKSIKDIKKRVNSSIVKEFVHCRPNKTWLRSCCNLVDEFKRFCSHSRFKKFFTTPKQVLRENFERDSDNPNCLDFAVEYLREDIKVVDDKQHLLTIEPSPQVIQNCIAAPTVSFTNTNESQTTPENTSSIRNPELNTGESIRNEDMLKMASLSSNKFGSEFQIGPRRSTLNFTPGAEVVAAVLERRADDQSNKGNTPFLPPKIGKISDLGDLCVPSANGTPVSEEIPKESSPNCVQMASVEELNNTITSENTKELGDIVGTVENAKPVGVEQSLAIDCAPKADCVPSEVDDVLKVFGIKTSVKNNTIGLSRRRGFTQQAPVPPKLTQVISAIDRTENPELLSTVLDALSGKEKEKSDINDINMYISEDDDISSAEHLEKTVEVKSEKVYDGQSSQNEQIPIASVFSSVFDPNKIINNTEEPPMFPEENPQPVAAPATPTIPPRDALVIKTEPGLGKSPVSSTVSRKRPRSVSPSQVNSLDEHKRKKKKDVCERNEFGRRIHPPSRIEIELQRQKAGKAKERSLEKREVANIKEKEKLSPIRYSKRELVPLYTNSFECPVCLSGVESGGIMRPSMICRFLERHLLPHFTKLDSRKECPICEKPVSFSGAKYQKTHKEMVREHILDCIFDGAEEIGEFECPFGRLRGKSIREVFEDPILSKKSYAPWELSHYFLAACQWVQRIVCNRAGHPIPSFKIIPPLLVDGVPRLSTRNSEQNRSRVGGHYGPAQRTSPDIPKPIDENPDNSKPGLQAKRKFNTPRNDETAENKITRRSLSKARTDRPLVDSNTNNVPPFRTKEPSVKEGLDHGRGDFPKHGYFPHVIVQRLGHALIQPNKLYHELDLVEKKLRFEDLRDLVNELMAHIISSPNPVNISEVARLWQFESWNPNFFSNGLSLNEILGYFCDEELLIMNEMRDGEIDISFPIPDTPRRDPRGCDGNCDWIIAGFLRKSHPKAIEFMNPPNSYEELKFLFDELVLADSMDKLFKLCEVFGLVLPSTNSVADAQGIILDSMVILWNNRDWKYEHASNDEQTKRRLAAKGLIRSVFEDLSSCSCSITFVKSLIDWHPLDELYLGITFKDLIKFQPVFDVAFKRIISFKIGGRSVGDWRIKPLELPISLSMTPKKIFALMRKQLHTDVPSELLTNKNLACQPHDEQMIRQLGVVICTVLYYNFGYISEAKLVRLLAWNKKSTYSKKTKCLQCGNYSLDDVLDRFPNLFEIINTEEGSVLCFKGFPAFSTGQNDKDDTSSVDGEAMDIDEPVLNPPNSTSTHPPSFQPFTSHFQLEVPLHTEESNDGDHKFWHSESYNALIGSNDYLPTKHANLLKNAEHEKEVIRQRQIEVEKKIRLTEQKLMTYRSQSQPMMDNVNQVIPYDLADRNHNDSQMYPYQEEQQQQQQPPPQEEYDFSQQQVDRTSFNPFASDCMYSKSDLQEQANFGRLSQTF